MHREQRQRTHALLKEKGIDRAIFANFFTIKWLTGFNPPVQVGPNPFAGGPPLVCYEDGQFTLIVVDGYAEIAAPFAQEPDGRVVTYLGYTIEQPLSGPVHLANAMKKGTTGWNGRKVGLETADLPFMLAHQLPTADFLPIDGWLEPLRMVKTAEELDKLRANFALTDLGHTVARRETAVGKKEIEVWAAIHAAIQRKAGCRVPLGNDCVVGHRQGNIGGWPLDHTIQPNGSLIVDLSTQLHGYWSDSCATYYPAEPTQRQQTVHQFVLQTLEFAISLVHPGAIASEIDQKVRDFITSAGYPDYPHHTGHGVGVSGHEGPRIVPYNNQVLQAGMVIMLEPGIYFPGELGVRLEDALLVTPDGAERLTHHDKGW